MAKDAKSRFTFEKGPLVAELKFKMAEPAEFCIFWVSALPSGVTFQIYRIIPNKGAPHSLAKTENTKNDKSPCNSFNNLPIFNPKPPLESSESQLQLYIIRLYLVRAPARLLGIIR